MSQKDNFDSYYKGYQKDTGFWPSGWETWQAAQAAQQPEIERLTQRVAELERALRDVKEWTDRCTTPGHPISTFCAKALGDK